MKEMVRDRPQKTVAKERARAVATEAIFALEGKRVWVAGHRGMVGSAIVRRLARENCEILTADRERSI